MKGVMRSLLCLIAMAPPVFACPRPPPEVEVVANEKATIAPDGGVIVRIERGAEGDRFLTVQADGAKVALTSEVIAHDLYVMRPKAGMKALEVVRRGKVVSTMRIAATPRLSAPKVARVSSTARRAAASKYEVASSQFSVEVSGDAPKDAYALVVYKIEGDAVRSVAHGKPNKRVFGYGTGGKSCSGSFEPIFAGERVAVAWLDVHGALSSRSAVMKVGTR